MSLQLVIIAGPDVGKALTLQRGDDLMLGRAQNSFYHLNDPRVSRAHCQLLLQGDQATVICNDGSGGTLVNGKAVKQQQLKLGDVLQVGDTQLRLHMGDFPLDVALGAINPQSLPPPAPIPAPDKLEALTGQTLSHYEIGPVIGKGRVGLVFLATDTKNSRQVAFKVLLPEFTQDEAETQRFIRGMKTAMPLRHPNLVATYGAGRTGPYCWIAMEYVAGENMMQVIDRLGVAGTLDWKNDFRMTVNVARALVYAHSEGIIHRNVTPTNILRETSTQTYKIGDLMLAKSLEGTTAEQITRPGELVGGVEYMAPERTRDSGVIDARSDLYGLGATAYALLAGRPPCEGKTLTEKITRIRQVMPERPTKYQMAIPGLFEGVVMKLLAKDLNDRYSSAAALLKELERIGKLSGVAL